MPRFTQSLAALFVLGTVVGPLGARAHEAPAPVVYSAPPVVYAPPPVVVVPPPVQVREKPERPPRPGFLAIKYMPGASSLLAFGDRSVQWDGVGFAHSVGLEVRLARWFALRSDLEFRRDGRTWDMLGVKLSLFPSSWVKPYASASFGASESRSNPGQFALGFAGAAGLDVFFGRYFFLEAEVRYRVTPSACCAEVPALAGLVGGGVAFF